MTSNSSTINFTQTDQRPLPCLPLISSHLARWDQIQLALYRQPPNRIPEHSSPHHVICINTGAPVTLHQTVDQRSETITSVPGDMGIYPAHLWQTFHWHQPAEFLQLYLEPMLLTHLGRELWGKDQIELIPQLASCFDPLIYQMAIALKTTLETDGIGSKLYADSMANALAVHLLCRYSAHQSLPRQDSGRLSQQQLRQVIDYIDENLDQNLSLSQLASIAHLSSYHFARLFKQSTGTPPHRYHIQRRIERAKQLLMAKELSIAEVAQVVGFASQAHLTYHFKRVVGVTPRVFVQQ